VTARRRPRLPSLAPAVGRVRSAGARGLAGVRGRLPGRRRSRARGDAAPEGARAPGGASSDDALHDDALPDAPAAVDALPDAPAPDDALPDDAAPDGARRPHGRGPRSLRAQLNVLVTVAGVCLAVLGLTSVVQVLALADATRDVARTTDEIVLPVARLRAQVERSSALVGQAAASDDVLARYTFVDRLADNDDAVGATVAELGEVLEPEVVGRVTEAVDAARRTRVQIMALVGKDEETFAKRFRLEYTPLIDAIGVELDALDEEMARRVTESVDASASRASTSVVLVVLVWVVGTVGTWGVATRVARRIRRNVGALHASIEAIAAGDLTHPADVVARDELGRAADALNTARGSLGGLLAGVRDTTDLVLESAGRVESGTVQADAVASGTSAQAGTVAGEAGEVRASVATAVEGTEQLEVSIREIARSASQAAQVAQSAGSVTGTTVTTVLELERASEEIGEVVDAITRIAKQTNLLALNASIEAARAGAAGRGFAVVADEVKELSLMTARQAQDIGERVGAIQAGTTETVRRIEEVRDMVARISDMQQTIASAVEEQTATSAELGGSVSRASTGADRIAEAIASVAEAARTSSTVAQELRPEAEQLADAARDLRERVDAFVF